MYEGFIDAKLDLDDGIKVCECFRELFYLFGIERSFDEVVGICQDREFFGNVISPSKGGFPSAKEHIENFANSLGNHL